MLQGPFRVPSFNGYIPRRLQPWIYLLFAFIFLMSGGIYGGAMSQVMGEYSLMREDVLMIIMFNVVGVAMPFPFLFKMKFHFTNRQLLLNAALVVATCNFLIMWTDSVPLMCILAYIAGFFKLCGTFECMSTIQLWMTSKRDFTIFFPLLYCIVLGNMFLSPWITEHLIYIYQDWRIINWAMTGALLLVALIVYVTTHDFRFMKPLPFISIDYLGCILWSAWMLEFIFFFTYGEHYNWLDSKIMQMDVLLFIFTGYFCIQRMFHIRHPYIEPAAWKYKRLIPLLILFAFVEFMGSTPKVLQTAFTGGVLHFGAITTNVLNFVEWTGAIAGCLFCLFWCKVLHQKYTRLLTIGVATMVCYPVMMYFLIDPGLNIDGTLSALLPAELRQRHLLLHAHRVSGRTDAVPAFLHGIDDGRHHPQRSDVGDVFRPVQFRAPLSDGRQHVARFALRCHQSSDAQHPESLWHHLSHRHCRADYLPALGCTAREKYPEEDAFLELRG